MQRCAARRRRGRAGGAAVTFDHCSRCGSDETRYCAVCIGGLIYCIGCGWNIKKGAESAPAEDKK